MPPTRAVLFDLDGTLCDRDAGWRSYLASQHVRLNFDRVHLATYQARALELEAKYRSQRLRVFEELCAEFHLPVEPTALLADFRARIAHHTALYDGARELLEQLRAQGFALGLVSNGTVQTQRGKIDATRVTELFDAILISEAEKLRKPATALFERATQKLGVAASECVFVGDDSVADIGGALHAGMQTVWLSWGRTWPPELDFHPDLMASTLREVSERITRLQRLKTESREPPRVLTVNAECKSREK